MHVRAHVDVSAAHTAPMPAALPLALTAGRREALVKGPPRIFCPHREVRDQPREGTPCFVVPVGPPAHRTPVRGGCATCAVRASGTAKAKDRSFADAEAWTVESLNRHLDPLKQGRKVSAAKFFELPVNSHIKPS